MKNFNEVLKQREKEAVERSADDNGMSLDNIERVKVLSPGQLVFKRFINNRLAIVGSVILIFMFVFSFIAPLFYPYSQTQIFYKYDTSIVEYAIASERTDFLSLMADTATELHYSVKNKLTSSILKMNADGENEVFLSDDAGKSYRLAKISENIYALYESSQAAGTGKPIDAIIGTGSNVSKEETLVAYLTNYVFDAYEDTSLITDEFRLQAVAAVAEGGSFSADGIEYVVVQDEEEMYVYAKSDTDTPAAVFSNLVIRAYNGEDILEFAFKEKVHEVIEQMEVDGTKNAVFTWELAQIDSNGKYVLDENGDVVKSESEIKVVNKNGNYVMSCPQITYLIDIYAPPSSTHLFGTDADGMDVMARMMYGGRVSLIFCFVTIMIEIILGVILGGIAGFFGGFTDNVIMRAVDVFFCIPAMPILIILGAVFDQLKMEPYTRVMWMMAVLGFLGWASVARMVRGQILSLREQEFMVAAEAIGLKTGRRIFKHLVPNVMPQLIVTASSGLGSIIIMESTLSFLGLGVKHPLATWGTMINSVSTAEAMVRYTYIWIPVGMLICLTVIAFNFVGDGLRDAFDPKMKR